MDNLDAKILKELQQDVSLSVDVLGDRVGLSRNAVWRRVKALESDGILKARVGLLDPEKIGLPLMVFLQVRAAEHTADWLEKFARATSAIPEILGVYRMSGDLDYLIRARVSDMADYDRLYQTLISRVPMRDVSASFVMEEIKETTSLPIRL